MSRCLAALSFVLVVLLCPRSFAAAPMCGVLGETIAAPPLVMPHDDGVIVAWYGCPDTDDDESPGISTYHEQQPRPVDATVQYDRAVAVFRCGLPKLSGELVLRAWHRLLAGPSGSVSEVFRPPRG